MRHVLRRVAILNAADHRTQCEAIHAAVAPFGAGEKGIRVLNDFIERMNAVGKPTTEQGGITSESSPEIAAFEAIAARAKAAT